MRTLIEILQRFHYLLLRWRKNVRDVLALICRGTLPYIPEVHYIDTAMRLSKPTSLGTPNQYFICIFVSTVLDIRADLSNTGTRPYINHEIPLCVIIWLLV